MGRRHDVVRLHRWPELLMLARRLMMGGRKYGSQTYSTPGTYTFTVPTGVTEVRVVAIGAGGGAGVGAAPSGAGGGGGSGGAIRATKAVSGGDSISIVVGFKGVLNGASGDPGGNSTVSHSGNTITAGGGGGGSGGGSGAGGAAGTTSNSGVWSTLSSSNGSAGAAGVSGVAGGNGADRTAFQGISGTGGPGDTTGTATLSALSATGVGAGGGGSYNRTFPTNYFAGSGADGYVFIEWNY